MQKEGINEEFPIGCLVELKPTVPKSVLKALAPEMIPDGKYTVVGYGAHKDTLLFEFEGSKEPLPVHKSHLKIVPN